MYSTYMYITELFFSVNKSIEYTTFTTFVLKKYNKSKRNIINGKRAFWVFSELISTKYDLKMSTYLSYLELN